MFLSLFEYLIKVYCSEHFHANNILRVCFWSTLWAFEGPTVYQTGALQHLCSILIFLLADPGKRTFLLSSLISVV